MSQRGASPDSIISALVDECLERAAQLGWEVLVADRVQQAHGRLVRFQLRYAPWARGQMMFQPLVNLGRQLVLYEIREQSHQLVAAFHGFSFRTSRFGRQPSFSLS
jgi:hypothetical protein